jgi:hypothetical protein
MLLEGEPVATRIGSRAPGGAVRRIFSFPVMLAVSLIMLAVLSVQDRFNDPDLWWHLKTGEIIWKTHAIPSTDVFSFTANGSPWTAQEWLSEVLIYGTWKAAGYRGLMALLCVLTALLLIVQYGLSSLYSGNAKVALLGALVAWLCSTVGLAIRPHLFGYLLLSVELLILELGRRGNPRWLMLLPLLFVVWVNSHSSFLLGLAILGAVFVCSCLDFEIGLLVSRPWESAKRKMLGAVFAASALALLANPVGVRQLIYPIDVMFRQKIGLAMVAEWQPLRFDEPRGLALLVVAALLVLIPLMRRSPLFFHELVLASAGLFLALPHQRMLFVFGLLVAPFLCRLLADTWDNYDSRRDLPVANALMMALFVYGIYWGFPAQAALEEQVSKGNPSRAVAYLRSSGVSGNMLNEYVFGGYLIWAAPEHKVFIDGRSDVYEWTGVLREFGDWATLQANPKELLDKYHVAFCLLSATSPMARVIPLIPGWTQVYSDDQAVVFTRSPLRTN